MVLNWVRASIPAGTRLPHYVPATNLHPAFWISTDRGELTALLDECAHMGAPLTSRSDGFGCNQHGWGYDLAGKNEILGSPSLRRLPVKRISDALVAVLAPKCVGPRRSNIFAEPIDITVHSHATLEFHYASESVLFDPWLNGPAYYGSWHLFPQPRVHVADLSPTAIVITHPHPDHFHLPTLNLIDRTIPIYFPSFPSRIIEKGLKELGFHSIHPTLWEDEIAISNEVKICFLRPRSQWEDSAVLLTLRSENSDFRWLNQVDAGAPLETGIIGEVDLLSSAFDQGASGYPLTWTSLSVSRKRNLMKASKEATLNNLIHRAQKVGAKWFLPFAGHWRLGRPEHASFSEMIIHTSLWELTEVFAKNAPDVQIVECYPGESYSFLDGKLTGNREVREEVDRGWSAFDLQSVDLCLPVSGEPLSKSETRDMDDFMSKLVRQADAYGCENVQFEVLSSDSTFKKIYYLAQGELQSTECNAIKVILPNFILRLLSSEEANWDHVAIGYWGEWSRSKESYPANFFRLLQAGPIPEYQKSSGGIHGDLEFLLDLSVQDLLESNTRLTASLLSRVGLPCAACSRMNSETLRTALLIHNVSIDEVGWLLREISEIV